MLALILILVYLAALLLLSISARGVTSDTTDFLLGGRRLTLPAFVATLVSTWYGGILGVGEYTWTVGLATWFVFGVPYYLAALLFALFLSERLRRGSAVSIPDLLDATYGRPARLVGAVGILALTVPAAYAVMLVVLIEHVTGLNATAALLVAVGFSAVYVGLSGFRAVVRTDVLQCVLMYAGFALLLPAALVYAGGLSAIWDTLPPAHTSLTGGLSWQLIVVWYLIALQTLVDPAFYQRVFAAGSSRVARRGVLVAVAFWLVFDALTTLSGLAARALLPDLDDPVAAFPRLAELVLPEPLVALFIVSLFATVMSTLDSYLFLAASTVGHDFAPNATGPSQRRRTRYGLAAAAALAAAGALVFDSAVTIWYGVGTVVTASLLLPVLAVHLPKRWRPRPSVAVAMMLAAATTAMLWLLGSSEEANLLGLEPMLAAMIVAAVVWMVDRALTRVKEDILRNG